MNYILLVCFLFNMNYVHISLTDTTGILQIQDPTQTKLIECTSKFEGKYFDVEIVSPPYSTEHSVESLDMFLYPEEQKMSIVAYTRDGKHEGAKVTIINGEHTSTAYVVDGEFFIHIPIHYGMNSFIVIAQEGNMIVTLTNMISVKITQKENKW